MKIEQRESYQRGFDACKREMIELVNCRYEQALVNEEHYDDEMLFGEVMALRDILFELEGTKTVSMPKDRKSYCDVCSYEAQF